MRKRRKKLGIEIFWQVTHFPWSCHIFWFMRSLDAWGLEVHGSWLLVIWSNGEAFFGLCSIYYVKYVKAHCVALSWGDISVHTTLVSLQIGVTFINALQSIPFQIRSSLLNPYMWPITSNPISCRQLRVSLFTIIQFHVNYNFFKSTPALVHKKKQ